MIDLEYICEEGGPEIGIFARDHQDKEQFFQEADKMLQEDFEGMSMDENCRTVESVEHTWWRDEPTKDEEFIQFIPCSSDEPGAYEVTVIRID